jgi:glyoxylase-like metal-dependent hydrolase (beta-lactamase superfamily II)
MKSGCFLLAAWALTLAGSRDIASAQTNRNLGAAVKTAVAGIQVLRIRDNVYMLTGAGGNITVLTFDDGVLLVDTGSAQNADKVLAVLKELSDKPVAHIINTSADPDHVGGNDKLAMSGRRIPRDTIAADTNAGSEGPMIIAHENVATRMSAPTGNQPPAPVRAWPNETYHFEYKKLSSHLRGGEAVQLFYEPAAHTDGDSLVWFRRSDIIMTGELFTTTNYPVIDVAKGGTINGAIKALNHVLELAFPFSRSEGGTMIVPGRGRLCDMADVGYYRDMVTIIRDRVQNMINKGMTLQQVKAANPTLDYEPRYGAKTGAWTTDMFVDAVYNTLKASKK